MREKTTRFMAESRKRRIPPVAIIFGLIGLITLVGLGFVFFAGESAQQVLDRVAALRKKAIRLDDRGDAQAALVAYREALSIVEDREAFRPTATDLRATLREFENRIARRAKGRLSD